MAVQLKNPNHGTEQYPEDIGASRHAFLSLSLGFFFIILTVSIISLSVLDVCVHYPSTHCTFELSISGCFSKSYWDLVSSFWKKKKKTVIIIFLRCEDETAMSGEMPLNFVNCSAPREACVCGKLVSPGAVHLILSQEHPIFYYQFWEFGGLCKHSVNHSWVLELGWRMFPKGLRVKDLVLRLTLLKSGRNY